MGRCFSLGGSSGLGLLHGGHSFNDQNNLVLFNASAKAPIHLSSIQLTPSPMSVSSAYFACAMCAMASMNSLESNSSMPPYCNQALSLRTSTRNRAYPALVARTALGHRGIFIFGLG